jgi:hypothetical protein
LFRPNVDAAARLRDLQTFGEPVQIGKMAVRFEQ